MLRLVALRDGQGRAHPVVADVGCRNTVFGGEAQEASGLTSFIISVQIASDRQVGLTLRNGNRVEDSHSACFLPFSRLALFSEQKVIRICSDPIYGVILGVKSHSFDVTNLKA